MTYLDAVLSLVSGTCFSWACESHRSFSKLHRLTQESLKEVEFLRHRLLEATDAAKAAYSLRRQCPCGDYTLGINIGDSEKTTEITETVNRLH